MTDLAGRLRRVDGQLEFSVWDGQRLPFTDHGFDYVLSSFAFHRYGEPLQALKEMWRVLSPGGTVYVLEPDRKSFGGLYSLWDYYFRLTSPGHVRYYSARELKSLMGRAGFNGAEEVLRSESVLRGGKLLASAVILRGQRDA
jgi:ubiquinone/menaquinone biosynthesis C-methylase UbiE